MADRDNRWLHERDLDEARMRRRQAGSERDFYGRDIYGDSYGEEGMTDYGARSRSFDTSYRSGDLRPYGAGGRASVGGGPAGRGYGPGSGSNPQSFGREDWGRGMGQHDDYGSGWGTPGSYSGPRPGARPREAYPPAYGESGRFGRSPVGYGRETSEFPDYAPNYRNRGEDRGWWDRASDEVSSWFGDDEAEMRRRADERYEMRHQGRGPKGYRRSDERIREDVSDRLTDDPYIDASEITVTVKDGEVTLDGNVDSRFARRRCEDMTEAVSGVGHVQNNLRVTSGSDTTREEREALARNPLKTE